MTGAVILLVVYVEISTAQRCAVELDGALAIAIPDRVGLESSVVRVDIEACSALEGVSAAAANEHIVAGAAGQAIIARVAEEKIRSAGPVNGVRAIRIVGTKDDFALIDERIEVGRE